MTEEKYNKLPELPPPLKDDAEKPLINKIEDVLENVDVNPDTKSVSIKISI